MNNHKVNTCVTISQVMECSIFSTAGALIFFPDPTHTPFCLGFCGNYFLGFLYSCTTCVCIPE